SGRDYLAGGGGNDRLIGGSGDDTMFSCFGNDTFVFAAGFGNDKIYGFDADPSRGGQDKIELEASLGVTEQNFAELVDIDVIGRNTIVTIGDNSITLYGVTGVGGNSVTRGDFIL